MALSVGSTNLVDLGSLSIQDYPFTFAGWFRVPDYSGILTLMRIRNAATGSYHGLYFEGHLANQAAAKTRTTATSTARSSTPMVAGQWHQVTGVFQSATERHVFLDAGSQGSVFHQRDFQSVDTYSVGNELGSNNIDAAHIAIFDIAISEASIHALAGGISPLAISESPRILCYHDLARRPNRPGLGPHATSSAAEIVVDQPRGLVAGLARPIVQPCRFEGPYSAIALEVEAGAAELGQIHSSGVQRDLGQASAA